MIFLLCRYSLVSDLVQQQSMHSNICLPSIDTSNRFRIIFIVIYPNLNLYPIQVYLNKLVKCEIRLFLADNLISSRLFRFTNSFFIISISYDTLCFILDFVIYVIMLLWSYRKSWQLTVVNSETSTIFNLVNSSNHPQYCTPLMILIMFLEVNQLLKL